MIYVGIDISKYKHDCFICKDTGEVIIENLSFENTKKGFQQFLDLLKPYDNDNVHIGLEATGHYGLNLKLFLEKNNYTFMEFNPLLVKEFKLLFAKNLCQFHINQIQNYFIINIQ